MGSVTRDQSHAIMSALMLNARWNEIDFDSAQLQDRVIRDPQEAGRQFTAFLQNGGRIVIGEPRILQVDRTRPFDPEGFIGKGWSIWKGPADGNGLEGDEEQDARSLALREIDLSQIRLVTGLEGEEKSLRGEDRLGRLNGAGHIRLDLKVFEAFWRNPHLIPKLFNEKTGGNVTLVFFEGTVLRSPIGSRYTLYLYWDGKQWGWRCGWLGRGRFVDYPSAVLASSTSN